MKGRIPAPAKALTLLDVYPVGSIYISTSAADPETLFGGTWEQLKNRFLLGAGGSYSVGSEGGEAEHSLTVDELASHTHYINGSVTGGGQENYAHFEAVTKSETITTWGIRSVATGGNQPHNNLPPYLAVYMWKRTA